MTSIAIVRISNRNLLVKVITHCLVLTHSRSILNISKVVRKHWNNLAINKAFEHIFQNEPVADFRRNKNLKETNP